MGGGGSLCAGGGGGGRFTESFREEGVTADAADTAKGGLEAVDEDGTSGGGTCDCRPITATEDAAAAATEDSAAEEELADERVDVGEEGPEVAGVETADREAMREAEVGRCGYGCGCGCACGCTC